ncbi:EamA family transporter [Rhizobium sp. 2MFCol3.1]|uniref:EamA family transporter n=1 Tax=Rhizobium sp. 2MFCol3.1 TaxID=1246459 RepID=UPI0003790E40
MYLSFARSGPGKTLRSAKLTTLYFSAPIITVFLSILVLKETVGTGRWIACAGGFVGVIIAAKLTPSPNLALSQLHCDVAACINMKFP